MDEPTSDKKESQHVFSLDDFDDNTVKREIIKQSLISRLPTIKEEANEGDIKK